jgi:SET domain-containing protein
LGIGVFARKTIAEGDELLVDYGEAFWNGNGDAVISTGLIDHDDNDDDDDDDHDDYDG